MTPQFADPGRRVTVTDAKMLMKAPLLPRGVLGSYGGDPGGVSGSWEEACTCVSTPIRVRAALAAGEFAHRLPQRLFLACPRPASMACALPGHRTRILRPPWVARGFRQLPWWVEGSPSTGGTFDESLT